MRNDTVACAALLLGVQAYNLMIHERGHRDDVSYTCEVCGKTFKRQDNLKQHR